MNNIQQSQSPESAKKSSRKALFAFPLGTLSIGMIVSWLSFLIFPSHPYYNSPNFIPPTWFFALIWCVLYPSMGLSVGYIWLTRDENDVRPIIALYMAMLFTNLLFLPISNLSHNNPGIMTLMDVNGVIYSMIYSWTCYRYSRRAFIWSIPLLFWMPVTAFLKIMLWFTVGV